jgi:Na+-translocating ferredoxin:NAD+ oxidoreductase RnfG subunit
MRVGAIGLAVPLALWAHAAARVAVAQTAPPARVAMSVRRVFGADALIDSVRADSATLLRISHGSTVNGFAVVRNVKGKDQPITFLVAVGPDGRLRDVDILVYREPYGGEIAYEAWRKQFRGKGPDAPLAVGKDIRGISGATISVNAVTLAVRRAVADFARWQARGLLR